MSPAPGIADRVAPDPAGPTPPSPQPSSLSSRHQWLGAPELALLRHWGDLLQVGQDVLAQLQAEEDVSLGGAADSSLWRALEEERSRRWQDWRQLSSELPAAGRRTSLVLLGAPRPQAP